MQPNLPSRAKASASFLKRMVKPLIEGFFSGIRLGIYSSLLNASPKRMLVPNKEDDRKAKRAIDVVHRRRNK